MKRPGYANYTGLMYRVRFLAGLILLIAPLPLASQQVHVASNQLWTWFGKCPEKKYVGIEVLQTGKIIYRSSFPVCPIRDRSDEVNKTIVFYFKGGHLFQGEYHTSTVQTIEGNIWQAGSDPGVILLGISFSTKKQEVLNTIHIAKPDRESSSEIDPGLTVRTFPLTQKTSE